MQSTDVALALGATMRLTRLITSDDLGRWWILDPLDAWVHRDKAREQYERTLAEWGDLKEKAPHPELAAPLAPGTRQPRRLRWHRYLAGLECAHCAGYWIGAGVLGSYAVAGRRPATLRAWRFVAGTLALNTVSVTAGKAVDYWS